MRIFIVEDNLQTQGYLLKTLGRVGHSVEMSADGAEALRRATTEAFDLFIVDRMLPGLDGLSLVKEIRRAGIATPVLMLTAMATISDRVDGLEAGADDYLLKPFTLAELTARVNALARRQVPRDAGATLSVGELSIDRLQRVVRRGETVIDLQPREFQLLEFLVLNIGRVVTRGMMLEQIWGFRFDPGTNIVETHISRLRLKLDRGGDEQLIHTVRGQGYVIRA